MYLSLIFPCSPIEITTPWYSLTADNPTIVYGTDSSTTVSSVTLTFTGNTSDTTYVSSVYYQMYYGDDRLTDPTLVPGSSIDSFNYQLTNLGFTDSGDYTMVVSFCYDRKEWQQYQATTTLTLERELISLPPLPPPPPLSLSLYIYISLNVAYISNTDFEYLGDDKVQLSCTVGGYFTYEYNHLIWFKGSTLLQTINGAVGPNSNRFDFTTGENASVPLQNGGSQSESGLVSYMTISSKESDDDGIYYCRILHSGVSDTVVLTTYKKS